MSTHQRPPDDYGRHNLSCATSTVSPIVLFWLPQPLATLGTVVSDSFLIFLLDHSDEYLSGLVTTLRLAGVSALLALAVGVTAGALWRSRLPAITLPITAYVEIFRNTPLILQVVYAYYAVPETGLQLTGFQSGLIALSLNAGAYLTVVVNAGLNNIDPGQRQAARVLGLSRRSTFWRVIFPQAARLAYAPIINQLILLIHGTSIMSIIAVQELTGVAGEVNSQTFLTLQAYGAAAILYVLLINGISLTADVVATFIFKPPLKRISAVAPWRTFTGMRGAGWGRIARRGQIM